MLHTYFITINRSPYPSHSYTFSVFQAICNIQTFKPPNMVVSNVCDVPTYRLSFHSDGLVNHARWAICHMRILIKEDVWCWRNLFCPRAWDCLSNWEYEHSHRWCRHNSMYNKPNDTFPMLRNTSQSSQPACYFTDSNLYFLMTNGGQLYGRLLE
jgi:hypothetical protein